MLFTVIALQWLSVDYFHTFPDAAPRPKPSCRLTCSSSLSRSARSRRIYKHGLGATQIACIIKNTEGKHPSPLSPTQPAGGHPAAAARVAHGVLQAPRSATFWVNKKGKKALRRPSRNKKERARDVLPLMGGRTKW